MQTFLPYSHYPSCARILDDRRLNKQIVEAWQILSGRVPNKNHPAVLMWQPYLSDLRVYLALMCIEYRKRHLKEHSVWESMGQLGRMEDFKPFPVTLRVRIAHTVNLIRKGVAVEKLTAHLRGLMGRPCELSEFPSGYFWPVDPVGRKAKADNENWKAFFQRNMI